MVYVMEEWIYWVTIAQLLLILLITHLKGIIYKWKRRSWLKTHVRLIMFHKNHTISSEWVMVDSKGEKQSSVVEYYDKAYLYRPERVYRLPPSFGMFSREPFMMVTEDSIEPLDMAEIMKQLKSKKTPEEFYEALHTKVFIDMMRGVGSDKAVKWMIILAVVAAGLYFLNEVFFKKGG